MATRFWKEPWRTKTGYVTGLGRLVETAERWVSEWPLIHTVPC